MRKAAISRVLLFNAEGNLWWITLREMANVCFRVCRRCRSLRCQLIIGLKIHHDQWWIRKYGGMAKATKTVIHKNQMKKKSYDRRNRFRSIGQRHCVQGFWANYLFLQFFSLSLVSISYEFPGPGRPLGEVRVTRGYFRVTWFAISVSTVAVDWQLITTYPHWALALNSLLLALQYWLLVFHCSTALGNHYSSLSAFSTLHCWMGFDFKATRVILQWLILRNGIQSAWVCAAL